MSEKRSLLLHVDEDENEYFYTPPCSSTDFVSRIANASTPTPTKSATAISVAVTPNSDSGICSTNQDGSAAEEDEEDHIPNVSFHNLYRFATKSDQFRIAIGCFLAILTGFFAPITNYAFGLVTKAMIAKGSNVTSCPANASSAQGVEAEAHQFSTPFMKSVETFVIYNCSCGLLQFVLGYSMVVCFNLVAERQAHKIRLNYFYSLLRQEIGWFDTNRKKDFTNRITEDILKIQEAMSEKVGLCLFTATNFTLLIAQSYYYGWKLSLLLTFPLPPIFIITYFQTTWSKWLTTKEEQVSSAIATVAQEVITNIRTVVAFNGQEKEAERYDEHLKAAKKLSLRKGAVLGLGHGLNWLCCFLNYSLAFWYGTRLVIESRERGDDLYGPDTIVVVFFGILLASYNIGSAADYFEAFGDGTGSARRIFATLDRVSKIDAIGADDGIIPAGRANGDIEFQNVNFSYPSRPCTPVLRGFSLNINSGQTIALVGRSGVGKSTCVQLLQRFYDVSGGAILLDGIDIRDLNLGWLRSQFGFVSQEPVLFNLTIYENIKLGKEGATRMEIEEAAKTAFAHDFITRLPEGYATLAGERGVQLSGGQKQRIAIARALVRNPPVLLLDEATSALDMRSEAVVQAALERARHGRTTLIVAHRLSTIKAADTVIVLDEGVTREVGSHAELMERKGLFYNLILDQSTDDIEEAVEFELDSSNLEVNAGSVTEETNTAGSYLRRASVAKGDCDKVENESEERAALMKNFRLLRMLKMGLPEWPYLLAAAFFTMLKGFNVPIYSIVFGNFIAIFASSDDQYVSDHGNFYAFLYLIIALVTGFSAFLQRLFAVLASERFTLRLRSLLFRVVLRQDISFFDEQENSIGRLCARLSSDASSLQGAIGNRLIGLIQVVTIISFSLAMSFYYLPKMGAVLCVFIPLAICSTMVEGKVLSSANITEKKAIENAVNIAVETLDHIRTVQSLGVQLKFMELYRTSLEKAHRINVRRAHIRALAYAFVYSMPYIAYSISIFYGAYLVENECAQIGDVFKVGEALIFGSMASGTALAYAPDYSKGKISAARIFKLFDRKQCTNSTGTNGKPLKNPKGNVEFHNVHFTYPLRPTVKALNNVSLSVHPGDQIGLVGQTGSGKSTIASLLLHFYSPQSGKITFDDEDLSDLSVHDLRQNMALVAQEPVLFDRTIAENIGYGAKSRECHINEIIEVAKEANIHEFITSLPAGYSTTVGSLGSQLSGGQKQRVCLARALLRNPKLLILDEATSALDANGERAVQEALEKSNEKAKEGRASIVIAHRLGSIQNSTHIIVLKDGRIVEQGSHEQLLSNCGEYHGMWFAQYRKRHKNGNDV